MNGKKEGGREAPCKVIDICLVGFGLVEPHHELILGRQGFELDLEAFAVRVRERGSEANPVGLILAGREGRYL
jgi:hypothetical protein